MIDRVKQIVSALLPRRVIEVLSRAKAIGRRRRAARRYEPLIAELFPAAKSHELLAAFQDSAVFRIERSSPPATIIKVCSSATAAEQLTNEANALDELAALDELGDWRSHIASVQARGEHDDGTWFTQSAVPGAPTSRVGAEAGELVAAAIVALQPMHQITARRVHVDDAVLEELVSAPLGTVQEWRPELTDAIGRVEASLRSKLAGRELTLSRLHGDYAPSNVLWDRDRRAVSGIVDWKFDEQLLPPEVDLLQYAISLRSERRRAEYGDIVIELLDDDGTSVGAEPARAAAAAGPNGFELDLAATMAWLHHASFGLHKAVDLRTNPIWLLNNVDRVLSRLDTGA